jgi:uncharacterized membrane protein
MDNRYTIIGIISLILGMLFFIYSSDTYFYFGEPSFLFMVSLICIIFGFVFVIIGLTEPNPNKTIKNIKPETTISMVELAKRGWIDKKIEPIDILKYRYAKGEITKEEFENMKQDLE